MKGKPLQIRFTPEGFRAIYDDRLLPLMKKGKTTIRRASHVEPTEAGKWQVDLSPVSPGTKLGPFETRDEALQEEVRWLKEHGIPTPRGN